MVATASRVTGAEVEELLPAGAIDPDHVHTPGIFVQRLILAERNEKRIEKRIMRAEVRSEEHTSELQSLMRISYAVFCLKKKKNKRKLKIKQTRPCITNKKPYKSVTKETRQKHRKILDYTIE